MRRLIRFAILSIVLFLNTGLKAKQIAYSNSGSPDSTQIIKVRKLPEFKVFLGSSSGDSISTAELDTVSRIYVKPANTLMKEGINYTIEEYQILIVLRQGGVYLFNVAGNKIPDELHNRLAELEAGGIIAFKEVTINTSQGIKRIYGVTLHVK